MTPVLAVDTHYPGPGPNTVQITILLHPQQTTLLLGSTWRSGNCAKQTKGNRGWLVEVTFSELFILWPSFHLQVLQLYVEK